MRRPWAHVFSVVLLGCAVASQASADDNTHLPALEFATAEPATRTTLTSALGRIVVPEGAGWNGTLPVSGRLVEWQTQVGATVQAGAPLATVSSRALNDMAADVKALAATLAAWRRAERDIGRSVKAGFQNDSTLRSTRQARAEAQGQWEAARQKLAERTGDLTRTERGWQWRASQAGVVTQLACTAGQWVTVQTPCLQLLRPDSRRLRVDLPPEGLADGATLTARSLDGASFTFERADQRIDARSGTQALYFVRSAREMPLLGRTLRVEIEGPAPADAVRVPRLAVMRIEGQSVVYVVDAAGKPGPKPVEVVGRRGQDLLVTGLAPQTRVVSKGAFELKSIRAFE